MIGFNVARTEIVQRFQGAGNVIGEKPHLRDWSEILVIAAAIYSIRAAIIQRRKNVKALKNANLWVFGALVVAEFRIRQLWITRTLDDEANRFKGSNEALTKEIEDLTGQNATLQNEMGPLKDQVAALGKVEVQLRQEVLQMQEAGVKENEELEGFKKIISGLSMGDEVVENDTAKLQAYVDQLEKEEKRLNEVGAKVQKQLESLLGEKTKLFEREKVLNLKEEELAKREEALQ